MHEPATDRDYDHHHEHKPKTADKNGIIDDVLGVDHGLGFGGLMGMSDLLAIGEHWARKDHDHRSHHHRHHDYFSDDEDDRNLHKLREFSQFIKFLSTDKRSARNNHLHYLQ